MRCCSSGLNASHARCWSANSVSPPSLGSSCACSSEPRLGLGLYEMSECQYTPASPRPIGSPFSLMFETIRISGWFFSWNWCSTWISSGPKRRLKSMCCAGVMRWSRKTSTWWSRCARWMRWKSAALIGSAMSSPTISAPTGASKGRTSKGCAGASAVGARERTAVMPRM
ncbi:hypothetical protein D3C72_1932010 [compost metagenome]